MRHEVKASFLKTNYATTKSTHYRTKEIHLKYNFNKICHQVNIIELHDNVVHEMVKNSCLF